MATVGLVTQYKVIAGDPTDETLLLMGEQLTDLALVKWRVVSTAIRKSDGWLIVILSREILSSGAK